MISNTTMFLNLNEIKKLMTQIVREIIAIKTRVTRTLHYSKIIHQLKIKRQIRISHNKIYMKIKVSPLKIHRAKTKSTKTMKTFLMMIVAKTVLCFDSQ